MKNLTIILLLTVLSLMSYGQAYWQIDPIHVMENDNAKLGTENKRSLNFVTDGEVRVIADSIGLFRIKGLAGKGYRLLYVDSLGNLGARSGGGSDANEDAIEYPTSCDPSIPFANPTSATDPLPCPSRPCLLNATPWFEGGNKIGNSGSNTVGTCTYHDFILKANGNNRIWIKTDGKIGVGTASPIGSFELQDATNAEIIATNTSANPSSLWVMNTVDNYGILVDGNGTGHISQNRGGSQHNLLGFGYNTTNTVPEQVWVGSRPTSGPHTDYNFAVGGKALCKSLYVSVAGSWADYVFSKDYKLQSLTEVEAFIIKNGHLPNVPAAKEIEEKEYGLNIAEMQKIQMQKIEELFLYSIKLEKEIEILKAQNAELLKVLKK